MMKSWRNRIMGIIVCAALVVGTVTVPARAEAAVPVPTPNTASDSSQSAPATPETPSVPSGNQGASAPVQSPVNGTGGEVNTDGIAPQSDKVYTFEEEWAAVNEMQITAMVGDHDEAAGKSIVTSGDTATLVIIHSNNETGTADPEAIDPQKLTAVISVPAGLGVSVPGNDTFVVEGTQDDGAGGTLITLRFLIVPGGGKGWSINALNLTTANGIKPHDSKEVFPVRWYYGDDANGVRELTDKYSVPEFYYETNVFSWTSVTQTVGGGGTVTGPEIPSFTNTFSLTNNANTTALGRAFTKEVVFEAEVTVNQYIIITEAILNQATWTCTSTNAEIDGVTYTPMTYHDAEKGYLSRYKVRLVVRNKTLSTGTIQDFANISAAMTLKGALVNEEKAIPAMGDKESLTISQAMYIPSTTGKAYAYPYVKVNLSSLKVDGEGQQYQELTKTTNNSVTVTYKQDPGEVPPVKEDPWTSGDIEKTVMQIQDISGTTHTSPATRLGVGYYGDKITYRLNGFGNKLKSQKLDNFVISDTFDNSKLYPISFTTGYYSQTGTFTLRVYVKNGDNIEEAYNTSYSRRYGSYTTNLPLTALTGNVGNYSGKPISPYDICKIEYDFGTVEAGFGFYGTSLNYRPRITLAVRNLGQEGPLQGGPVIDLVNTADVSFSATFEDGTEGEYNYDGRPAYMKDDENKFRSSITNTYYGVDLPQTGNKSFIKVNGKNPTAKVLEKDDILEYTITFRNPSDQEAQDPFIDDEFQGLSPYITDELGYGIEAQGLGTAPFIKVGSVVDELGKTVTSTRNLTFDSVYVGPISWKDGHTSASGANAGAYRYSEKSVTERNIEPMLEKNMMRIRLKSDEHIQPGDIITVTYLMRVTDPTKVENKFKAYGYPIPVGGEELIPFTGGDNKPDGDIKVLQPSINFTQSISRTGSASNPIKQDEAVTVTMTFTNSNADRTPPVTLLGFASRLDNTYHDYLKIQKGDTVEVKIFETSSSSVPIETRTVKVANAPSGMVFDNCTEQAAMVLTSGLLNQPDPITVKRGMKVTMAYTIKGGSEVTKNAAAFTQTHYSYAIMKDEKGNFTFNGSNSTSIQPCNWVTDANAYVQSGGTNIYVPQSGDPTLQLGVNVPTNLALNNVATVARTTTTNGIGVLIRNKSTGAFDFTLSKIYVRLPRNEKFTGIITDSRNTQNYYNAKSLGKFGELGNEREVVELTRTTPSPFVMKQNYNASGSSYSTNSDYYIYLGTEIDEETAEKMIADNLEQSPFTDSQADVAIFSEGTEVFAPHASCEEMTAAEMAAWGSEQWDINPADGALYKLKTPVSATYSAVYSKPGLKMSTYVEQNNVLQPVAGTDALFDPYQRLGWHISVKSDTLNLKDPAVVLRLPADITYTRVVNTDGKTEHAYTQTAERFTGSDGYNYVVIPLEKDLTSTDTSFIVATTLGSEYGNRTVDAYLTSAQYFYQITSSSGYGSRAVQEFSTELKDKLHFTPSKYVVTNSNTVRITGKFAFNTVKEVKVIGGGKDIDRGVEAKSREGQTMEYTLTLYNESYGRSSLPYNKLTLIDRLPNVGDKYIAAVNDRGSTTNTTLLSAPTVERFKSANGTETDKKTLVYGTDYEMEYTAAAPDQVFNNGDFGLGGSPAATWVPAADWQAGDQPTAFRVMLKETLNAEHAIRIKFTAAAPEEDMPRFNATAINTFAAGFEAQLSGDTHQLKPEANYVRVVFPDVKPMIIEGIVFTEEPGEEDGVYHAGKDKLFTDFTPGAVTMTLYRMDNNNGVQGGQVTIEATQDLNPNESTYRFTDIYDDGFYFVGISPLPEGYELYQEYMEQHDQGNKFYYSTSTTDPIMYKEDETFIRNADVVERMTGTLTLEKKLRNSIFSTDDGMVGKNHQNFVFKVDYIPKGGSTITRTFYEVLKGGESKTVVDLPQGTYIVTEVENWAVDYIQASDAVYKNGKEISRKSPDISASITNTRYQQPFLHAIADALNDFNKPTEQD